MLNVVLLYKSIDIFRVHSLTIGTPYTFLLENKYIPCTISCSDVNSEIQFIHLANLQKTVFSICLEI